MTDYTYEIAELIEARGKMQALKKSIASEVRANHEAAILREITEKQAAIEAAFAQKLAVAVAGGVPQKLVRSQVLRTNDWERWTYWRDLAQIEPDRITVRNAKKAVAKENAIFFWNEDGDLVVKRASDGTPVEPVTFLWSTVRESNGRYLIDAADFADESRILRNDVPLRKIVEDAVRARVAEVGL